MFVFESGLELLKKGDPDSTSLPPHERRTVIGDGGWLNEPPLKNSGAKSGIKNLSLNRVLWILSQIVFALQNY